MNCDRMREKLGQKIDQGKLKTHLYLNGSTCDECGYPKTACGKDGIKVGGMIVPFFRLNLNDSKNCKTCVKIYRKVYVR